MSSQKNYNVTIIEQYETALLSIFQRNMSLYLINQKDHFKSFIF